jgi:hypothetical protein
MTFVAAKSVGDDRKTMSLMGSPVRSGGEIDNVQDLSHIAERGGSFQVC